MARKLNTQSKSAHEKEELQDKSFSEKSEYGTNGERVFHFRLKCVFCQSSEVPTFFVDRREEERSDAWEALQFVGFFCVSQLDGSVAERSKALGLGSSPKGRGFESLHYQYFLLIFKQPN